MTPVPSSRAYAYGHLDVTVAIVAPPAAAVRAWLPRGLSLATQAMTPAGTHPVMLMFGEHSHVRPWFRPPSSGGSYGEWIVATPMLESTDARGQTTPWAHMSRLFLNSPWFVLMGWLYAYPKMLARVSAPPGAYSVNTLLRGRPKVEMRWESAGPVVPWGDFPGASRLAPVFEQPFIERFALLPEMGSRMWFDIERASIQPARAHITLQQGCAPGLPAMTVDAGSIIDGVPGAFRLSCDWMLSRPYLASRLPQALKISRRLTFEDPTMPKQRIAILGSGVGSITAAWALTSLPGWSDRYEITIYTLGWRLGGKGASGRNAQYGQRIEEHGLHIWMGFYDNAFRAMQECYGELDRPATCPIRTWTDAFRPHNEIVLYEFINGRWRDWPITVPMLPGVPGTDREPHEITTLFEMLVHWLAEVFTSQVHQPALLKLLARWREDGRPGWIGQELHNAATFIETHLPGLAGLINAGHDAGLLGWIAEGLHEAGRIASAARAGATADLGALVAHLEGFTERLGSLAHHLIDANDDVRRVWTLMELGSAIVRGMVRDGVLTRGFDAIAGTDFREWLRRHGASEEVLSSAVVRTMYDLCFAFVDGELDRPDMDAAVFLRTVMLMVLTFRGGFMYRMNAGMGDVVFGPYDEALERRGVRFEFFHRVRSLGLSEDGSAVDTIAVDRQVTLKDGRAEYDPFVTVKGLPCWPSAPNFDQIEGGDALAASGQNLESHSCTWPVAESRVLRRGQDFDQIVLGISLGALPQICASLVDRSAAWRGMCEKVKTVETQGVQLWLRRTLPDLGWIGPPVVGGTYAEPLDTWADMSDLLAAEDWTGASPPQSIVYLCGPLREQAGSEQELETEDFLDPQVMTIARTWLQSHMAVVLPKGASVSNPSGLDLNWLHAPVHPEDPLLDQYLRANRDPSERYVLSVAGSSAFRLRAGQSGFSNLFLAGDWVWTPLNAGCVEAATMAGLDAARELSGVPIPIFGWPDLQPTTRGGSS